MSPNMLSVASITLWPSTTCESIVLADFSRHALRRHRVDRLLPMGHRIGDLGVVGARGVRPAALDQRGGEGAGQRPHEVGDAGRVRLLVWIDAGHGETGHGDEEHHHEHAGDERRPGHLQEGHVGA